MFTGLVPHVGGPISGPCAPTVLIGSLPSARISDMCVCVGPPDAILTGCRSVIIGGMPAARIGDSTVHGGVIVLGLPTVLIGDDSGAGGGRQAAALASASRNGAPFCEICAA
ncbi:PAAR domain-containing protein [Roseomonas sp. CCTCC AB2023176]|uniref:PAAR domain-containing protein n=1 Tax=Roseomonas sp. CCTCC AB2023176 TaxID=3342640 RepID=UPI0035E117DF